MQIMKSPKSSAKVVWAYGAIAGVCLGIILSAFLILRGIGLILDGIFIIVAFLVVGMLASKRTGRASTGTLAGLVTGLISSIIFMVIWSVLLLTVEQESFIRGLSSSTHTAHPELLAVAGLAFIGVFLALIMLGLGAGIGTLGGLVSKSKAKVPPTDYPTYAPYPPETQFQEYPPQPIQYPPLPSHYMQNPLQQQMSQIDQTPPPPPPPY